MKPTKTMKPKPHKAWTRMNAHELAEATKDLANVKEADALARSQGVTRSQLIAQGLRTLIRKAG